MNRLIEYGTVEAIPFYNCSRQSFEEWEATGVKRQWLGYPLIVFGTFIELLYIPIIYIIFKTRLIKHACYKIIVVLAFIDMCATCCSCLITGPLLILGSVFCMYPTFTYVAGSFALAMWCMACATTVSLFANRILSIAFHEYADVIEKRLAYFSIVFSISYGFYMFMFTPTICYNSVWISWIPDPLSELTPSEKAADMYKNRPQAWNNWVFVSCMFILFSIYCGMVKKIARGQKSKASMAIFIQCIIICFFNTVSALIYNALSFVTPDFWILLLGQLCWSINHGCPALIYITMNETIKREFKKLVFGITTKYKNRPQAWNNWVFVSCMFILFSIYCGMFKKIVRGQKSKASMAVS
ncbi:hypothetical protein GCK72_012802 [Caenorhabditis remanei]|uniref:Uncharacterized protein n=1 Tax=Caenorhabditis remanei TaxID=31234 RepID=A0A6A5GPF5_CAERE|nr:hypothetical protein GCK72_012802 [Caenorhabditis remanei]KAF1756349.1 hypothetical protein GCK72_012802 [Caenorhabditis remanei]